VKLSTVEVIKGMIESVTQIAGLWAIVTSLAVLSIHFVLKPAPIFVNQPLKRYKFGLKLRLR
jgi:hypothetical protein